MSKNNDGCLIISIIILVIFAVYKLLEFLLFAKSEAANLLGVGLIMFLIGYVFWLFNRKK